MATIFHRSGCGVSETQPCRCGVDPIESSEAVALAKSLGIHFCEDLWEEGEPWEVPAEPEPQYFERLADAIKFYFELLAKREEPSTERKAA